MKAREQDHEPEQDLEPEHNPALVPDESERVEQSYRVTGPHTVLGYAPGMSFTALIPAEQEALLIESGHIERSNPEG